MSCLWISKRVPSPDPWLWGCFPGAQWAGWDRAQGPSLSSGSCSQDLAGEVLSLWNHWKGKAAGRRGVLPVRSLRRSSRCFLGCYLICVKVHFWDMEYSEFCIFLCLLWGVLHVVCPRKCLEKRNVSAWNIPTPDMPISVNSCSFSRELVFKFSHFSKAQIHLDQCLWLSGILMGCTVCVSFGNLETTATC